MSADILDILFDGRNKEYGAYDLRKTYNKRIKVAIIGMISACVLMVVGALLANAHKKKGPDIIVADMTLQNVQDEK
ncbi:MAG TPA: hypothetical protein VG842_00680, partial [Sediminibacterium sp.]|nr:hypothetical protein [Sediminibacterium sp.]